MRRVFYAALLLLTAAAADPVVAVRGNDEMTAGQLRALIADAPPETRHQLETNPAALKALIRDTFLGRAILAEAQAAKWDQRPEVISLAQRAHDLAITQSFLTSQAQVPANYPSEAELQAAWEANKAQLMQPRQDHLAQIFVTGGDAAAQDAARRKLTDLRAQITHGHAGFEAAARKLPGVQYADMGWLAENRLQPAARDAVSGLPEGEISPPVCTPNGCALVKLLATRPAGPAPLADVRPQLINALRAQKARELQQAYANALLARQPVQVNEIELGHVTKP